MIFYFMGFKELKETLKELYDQKVFTFTNSKDLLEISPPELKRGVILINATKDTTISKSEITELIGTMAKFPGIHLMVITDSTEEHIRKHKGVMFSPSLNGSTDKILAGSVRKIKKSMKSFVGVSPAIRDLKLRIMSSAFSDPNVLILGETGTGKTLLANVIHEISWREGPMVSLNCASVPTSLLESELFGHTRGAFTGAISSKRGIIESSNNGHVFLDEVGELSSYIQAKLLHVVEDGIYNVIGDPTTKKINVRFISATNRDISYLRKDLFFRLSEVVLEIPPLRQRREDIPVLFDHFFKSSSYDVRFGDLPDRDKSLLLNHPYPGNVRELRNILGRYMYTGKINLDQSVSNLVPPFFANFDIHISDVISDTTSLLIESLRKKEVLPKLPNLREHVTSTLEKQYVTHALNIFKWDKHRTSQALGVSYRYLNKLISKYGIDKRLNRKKI